MFARICVTRADTQVCPYASFPHAGETTSSLREATQGMVALSFLMNSRFSASFDASFFFTSFQVPGQSL